MRKLVEQYILRLGFDDHLRLPVEIAFDTYPTWETMEKAAKLNKADWVQVIKRGVMTEVPE